MILPTPREFRFAARRLRAAPLFTLFAVLSLAIGVGVTTIAYSVVSDLFFTTVGVRNPDGVAVVVAPRSGTLLTTFLTPTEFERLRDAQRSFLTLSASAPFSAGVTGSERTMFVATEAVDGAYFTTVGMVPLMGRAIQPADEASRRPVAVLGHALWREQFGSDPAVVGRAIRIDGRSFDVVGVAPEGFKGMLAGPAVRRTAVWIPLETLPAQRRVAAIGFEGPRRLFAFGRLRPAVHIEAASAEVATIAAALDTTAPRTTGEQDAAREQPRGWTLRGIVDVRRQAAGAERLGFVMAGLVALVLVVACTNLANLVLARGTIRHQDVAVRRALGAGDWRLIREQLAESLIIAGAGGVAAYGVMRVTAVVAARDLPLFAGLTLSIRPHVDTGTLVVAAAALAMALVVFGLEPAIRLARTSDVRGPLATTAARMGRLGRYRILLRWQVTAATAFFIIAAIAVRYVVADLRHDSGVRLDGLAVAQLDFGDGWDDARVRRALARMTEEARRSPAIDSIAASNALPFGTAPNVARVSAAASNARPGATTVTLVTGSPNLLAVLGVPIVRGRPLTEADSGAAAQAVIINEKAAGEMFGTVDVVGRQVLLGAADESSATRSAAWTIVGVAANTDTTVYMGRERGAVLYVSLEQRFERPSILAVRAAGDTDAAILALQAAIRRADPDLAIVTLGPGPEILGGPFTLVRFIGNSALSLGMVTLLLAMVGLYGIQSQAVSLRTREIGVRLSFGATAGQMKRMVLADSYRPVLEGLVLGLAGGITGRVILIAYLDVPLSVVDPWMLMLVPMPLVLAAFCAGYLPARRAANVNPGVALRDQ